MEKKEKKKKVATKKQSEEVKRLEDKEVILRIIHFLHNPTPYRPLVPYHKKLIDKEVLKKLHINIPFVDALLKMTSYTKFMKDILSNKRKLEEFETIALIRECSAIFQKKLPLKLKDPRSFCIPCTLGQCNFKKVLCDLGVSVNLLPLLVSKKLGLRKVKLAIVSLLLAYQLVKHLRGILENVLTKIDSLYF